MATLHWTGRSHELRMRPLRTYSLCSYRVPEDAKGVNFDICDVAGFQIEWRSPSVADSRWSSREDEVARLQSEHHGEVRDQLRYRKDHLLRVTRLQLLTV